MSNKDKIEGKENKIIYNILMLGIVKVIFNILFRPKYENRDNIPKSDSVILCGNHTKFLDCILIMQSTNRFVHFLAKKELLDSKFSFIFKLFKIIPVDRFSNDKHRNDNVKNEVVSNLNSGRLIAIFPEGTINNTKNLILPFKKGAAQFAIDTNSYIVPFVIVGKYGLFNRVKIVFGEKYKVTSKDIVKETKKLEDIIKKMLLDNRK